MLSSRNVILQNNLGILSRSLKPVIIITYEKWGDFHKTTL